MMKDASNEGYPAPVWIPDACVSYFHILFAILFKQEFMWDDSHVDTILVQSSDQQLSHCEQENMGLTNLPQLAPETLSHFVTCYI